MKECPYCAQTDTKKDSFGYCKQYNCFGISGMRDELNHLIRRAGDIWTMPDTYGQVSGPITNCYSHRTRKANDIMRDATNIFGFVPFELINRIPEKNRGRWDKNIRW